MDEIDEAGLPGLMLMVGEQSIDGTHHVMVRFDPERDAKKFTITIDGIRLTDTDDPTEALRDWILKWED